MSVLSLDELSPETRYAQEAVDTESPDAAFERRWASTVVEQVLARLKQEYVEGGKAGLFAKLESALTGEVGTGVYAEWAAALGMSEGAVKVALHRMRRRFGELLRSEVAHTVSSPEEIDDEIRHLFAAIAN